MASTAETFYGKVWKAHSVAELGGGDALLWVDRVTLAETNGGTALAELAKEGRTVANPAHVFAILDHIVSIRVGRGKNEAGMENFAPLIPEFRHFSKQYNLNFYDIGDARQGITHVVAPEMGICLPGTTYACSDSHATTVGGVGAIGWGIGTSETKTILATQTRVANRPKQMRVTFDGPLPAGVSGKDVVLYLISKIGVKAGAGYAVEFAGSTIASLSVEERLTLCNMGVEFATDCAFVPPDDVTFQYLDGRQYAPKGRDWDDAVAYWRGLRTDDGAAFDVEHSFSGRDIQPQVSWGTSVQHVVGIGGRVPDPATISDPAEREQAEAALAYVKLTPGTALEGVPVEGAYIGSCTNGRLNDLREAASILKGRKVAEGVVAICSPGSTRVKLEAEAEGIADIFKDAGFQWLESGCGFCGATSGDDYANKRVISSTNRNYEHRQSPGAISHISSPAMVAASAVRGAITDPRKFAN